ncbi:Vacuolar protein sorting-associated protein 54 [Armadillidium vulgare]|nr:Vacuolar protein sorting-associated protein 54 [Armadillidium vulgare]
MMTDYFKAVKTSNYVRGWNRCQFCSKFEFKSPNDFLRHLRENHCTQEGGSFVCLYGQNDVCTSLPLEGVSDKDYEEHVVKHHASLMVPKVSSGMSATKDTRENPTFEKWGVFSSTQNIPSVLNDPKTGMKRDFFTKVWGESFVESKEVLPHPALPEITVRHFESYIRRLRKRQKLLNRIANKEASKAESCSDSIINISSNSEQVVPSLFLSSSFNLQDPTTFYSVFTHITSSGISKRNAKPLQEKLFHYLEIIESDMSRQIARKSSAFFDTMMYLNAQMEQLKLNHKAVLTLRNGISNLKDEVVLKPMNILSLPRKKENILSAMKKLENMRTVREVQSTIQLQLAHQEYASALDLISTTQDLLSSELSAIKGLRHLSSELQEHEKLIEKMIAAEFNKYIADDLNRPLSDLKDLLDEDLFIGIIFAILRLPKFDFMECLKNEVNAAVNATLKQVVAEAVSKSEVDLETTSVADQARALNVPEWLVLLGDVTNSLRVIIQRVKAMVEVMTQAVETSSGRSASASDGIQAASIVTMGAVEVTESILDEAAYTKALSGLQETLCGACDFAHDRCAKLLHARSRDQGLDKMSANEFLNLSGIIESFVEDTHKISGRKSSPFRMGLQGQATRFVSRFHEERDARLNANLKNERWKVVSVPSDVQLLLDHISTTGLLQFPPVQPQCNTSVPNGPSTSNELTASSSTSSLVSLSNGMSEQGSSLKGVKIFGEEYVIVGVCVVVVRVIVEYAECALTLRLAAQQLLTRLIDLLRKFNADTCRLLIDAGAVFLGLKTISIKHLALGMRSLQLLLTIIPKLTHHFSDILGLPSVEKHIDQLTREYEDHCEAIEKKIINVMSDSIEKHLVLWEARSPVPSQAFNNILKLLTKLYDAIAGILPTREVQVLFEKLTAALKVQMKFHLKRLGVSPVGPQCW